MPIRAQPERDWPRLPRRPCLSPPIQLSPRQATPACAQLDYRCAALTVQPAPAMPRLTLHAHVTHASFTPLLPCPASPTYPRHSWHNAPRLPNPTELTLTRRADEGRTTPCPHRACQARPCRSLFSRAAPRSARTCRACRPPNAYPAMPSSTQSRLPRFTRPNKAIHISSRQATPA
jgi:hypothetical protein